MKKINLLQIISITFLVLLICSFANAASFNDVTTDQANSDAIEYVKTNKIVEGYPDGSFKPDKTINRAEFTKIIVGAKFDIATIDNCIAANIHADWTYVFFPDVPKDAWFAKYICVAKMNSIVAGYQDGSFKPENKINFAEASKIIVNTFGYTVGTDSVWYKPFVEKLGEVKAIPTTITGFSKNITRGEMAEMVYRLKADITNKESLNYETVAFGERIISLDGTWDKYTNTKFGFSIKIPKSSWVAKCGWTGKPEDWEYVPTKVFSDEKAVFISNEYYYQGSATNCQKIENTLSSVQQNEVWKIIVQDINDEAGLNKFIQQVYMPECSKEDLLPTSQNDVYKVKLTPGEAGEGCFVNWVSNLLYSPGRHKAAKWDMGQEARFNYDGGTYDEDMSKSFMFLDSGENTNQTVDWKTYRNNTYGFEIKAPKEWKIRDEFLPDNYDFYSDELGIADNGCGFTKESANQQNVVDWYKAYYQREQTNAQTKDLPLTLPVPELFNEKTINSIPAIEANSIFATDKTVTTIYLVHDNNVFICSYPDSDPNDSKFKDHFELYKKVAASFKFIENKYTNSQYGYIVNYPYGWHFKETGGTYFTQAVGFNPNGVTDEDYKTIVALLSVDRQEYLNSFDSNTNLKIDREISDFPINGIAGAKFVYKNLTTGGTFSIYTIISNGKTYVIEPGESDENVFLNSFELE